MNDDRRSDWHNSVDERLVNLNSAQVTTDVELAKLEQELAKIDGILRGDPEDGLVESINQLKTEINKFNRVLDKDYLGHGGLVSFVTYLFNQEASKARREGYHWTFWTAFVPVVVAQLLILIGLLVVNWDKIQEYILLHKHIYQAAAIERTTKQLKLDRIKARKAKAHTKAVKVSDDSETALSE